MNYETKLKSELPRGSYSRDPGDNDQLELGIWGKHLDNIELENKILLEGIASPELAPEWMIKLYETQYKTNPAAGTDLNDRRTKVLGAMQKSCNISSMQNIARRSLGYLPNIKTSPRAFYLGSSTFDSGAKLVADHIKFAFWIELQSAITVKPYDDASLISALLKAAPADVIYIWTYWDDEVFDWNDYNP